MQLPVTNARLYMVRSSTYPYAMSSDPVVKLQWFVTWREKQPFPYRAVFYDFHPDHKNALAARRFVAQRFTLSEAEAVKSCFDATSHFDTRIVEEELPLSIARPIPFLHGSVPLREAEGWFGGDALPCADGYFGFAARFRVPIVPNDHWARERLLFSLPQGMSIT